MLWELFRNASQHDIVFMEKYKKIFWGYPLLSGAMNKYLQEGLKSEWMYFVEVDN